MLLTRPLAVLAGVACAAACGLAVAADSGGSSVQGLAPARTSAGAAVTTRSAALRRTTAPAAPRHAVMAAHRHAAVVARPTRAAVRAAWPATPGAASSPGPRRAAGAAGAAGPGYSFLFPVTAAGPLRWNPCRPVHIVTNLAAAPALRVDLAAALARLTTATGIVFVVDGDTAETPSVDRPVARDGRWSPVLVAVADSDLLVRGDAGEGRAQWWRTPSGVTELVSGQVVLRPGSYPTRVGGFADPNAAGPMLLHELGHALGLGHTTTPGAIMNHDGALRGTSLSLGDLAGLRRLGRAAGCLPELTPPDG